MHLYGLLHQYLLCVIIKINPLIVKITLTVTNTIITTAKIIIIIVIKTTTII